MSGLLLKHIEMRGMRSQLELFEAVRLVSATIDEYDEEQSVSYVFRQLSDLRCCLVRTIVSLYGAGANMSVFKALEFWDVVFVEAVRRTLMGHEDEAGVEKVRRTLRRMKQIEIGAGIEFPRKLITTDVDEVNELPLSQLNTHVSKTFVRITDEKHPVLFELTTIVSGERLEAEFERDLAEFWLEHREGHEHGDDAEMPEAVSVVRPSSSMPEAGGREEEAETEHGEQRQA